MKTETRDKIKYLPNVVVVGDIHGEFRKAGHKAKEQYKITDAVIFFAGDIGMGFEKFNYYVDEFKRLEKIGKSKNIVFCFVRGNHDDPSYFNGENADKLNEIFDNVCMISDYDVIETFEGNVLCIGGGISIDRTNRIPDKEYWWDEICKYDKEKCQSMKDISIVITHSAPSFCYPHDKGGIEHWLLKDMALDNDIRIERDNLDSVYKDLIVNNKLKYWIYGHYHYSNDEVIDGIKFKLCNCDEFYPIY